MREFVNGSLLLVQFFKHATCICRPRMRYAVKLAFFFVLSHISFSHLIWSKKMLVALFDAFFLFNACLERMQVLRAMHTLNHLLHWDEAISIIHLRQVGLISRCTQNWALILLIPFAAYQIDLANRLNILLQNNCKKDINFISRNFHQWDAATIVHISLAAVETSESMMVMNGSIDF